MDSHQEHHAWQAPEVVQTTHYPEALAPNHHHHQYAQGQPAAVKPEDGLVPGSHLSGSTPYSIYGGSQFDHGSPPSPYAQPTAAGLDGADQPGGGDGARTKKKSGTILGCTTLVFVLCAVIVILAAAVVGLAAGTGVEAHRASAAEARASASASRAAATVTVTSSAPTSTSFADIDDNCSGNPGGVTGTTYKAFSVIGDYAFTIQCNADAAGSPLMSLFTADLNSCMDACAAWSKYLPALLGNDTTGDSSSSSSSSNNNATCGAVSFIPSWTNKTAALKAGNGAPGNCYLKPTSTESATTPNGQEVHAGILQTT